MHDSSLIPGYQVDPLQVHSREFFLRGDPFVKSRDDFLVVRKSFRLFQNFFCIDLARCRSRSLHSTWFCPGLLLGRG